VAKDVLGLEISMEETILMETRESCGYFEKDGTDFIFCEGTIAFLGSSVDLIEIALEVVKDKKEF
jgi:hypothetical protein